MYSKIRRKKTFIKAENNVVMILCVIYLRLPFLEQHGRNENLFIFPPTCMITMFLQMENMTLIILCKALNSCSHTPYVIWRGYHLLIAYI